MKKLLITGGTGFIGRKLILKARKQYKVTTVVRGELMSIDSTSVGQFNSETNFSPALSNVDIVIHLAAKAHVIGHSKTSQLEEFREPNTHATINLARQAASLGVKRFIFISSIGVNGISNTSPFKHSDNANPTEDYAISKYEAEIGLKKLAEETGMEVVIIRPPLVYGKEAPGNFGSLLKLAIKNLPLPLGAVHNKRSFVSLDNLLDLIITCIEHPKAANNIFLVSDDEYISTTNLIKKLTLAAGKQPILLPIPVGYLKFFAGLINKKAAVERFSSSLTVDIEHTKSTLNWTPPISVDEGINRCFENITQDIK